MMRLFERLPELPPDGKETVWYYPGATKNHGKDGTLLRLFKSDGSSWIATIAGPASDVFEMPDGKHVFVNGHLINAEDPMQWSSIETSFPLWGVTWSEDRSIVVFQDRHFVEAYGRSGKLGLSPPIALDGLEVTACNDSEITCRGYVSDPLTDEEQWQTLTLDTRFGVVIRIGTQS